MTLDQRVNAARTEDVAWQSGQTASALRAEPGAGQWTQVRHCRRAPKFARGRLVLHLFVAVWRICTRYRRVDKAGRRQMIQQWSEDLLALCGLTLCVHRAPDVPVLNDGAMLVSNHVSWLDIYVINAWRPTPFVSKAEIAKWPVVGFLARSIGTVFIRREKRGDARRIVDQLRDVLSGGGLVCLFPEGTTGDGLAVLPFHANIFEAAVAAGAPIQPVCLLYEAVRDCVENDELASSAPDPASHERRPGTQSLAPAYVGDMSLGETLRRVLLGGPIVAHLYVGAPLTAMPDRRQASRSAHSAITVMLAEMQRHMLAPSDAERDALTRNS